MSPTCTSGFAGESCVRPAGFFFAMWIMMNLPQAKHAAPFHLCNTFVGRLSRKESLPPVDAFHGLPSSHSRIPVGWGFPQLSVFVNKATQLSSNTGQWLALLHAVHSCCGTGRTGEP